MTDLKTVLSIKEGLTAFIHLNLGNFNIGSTDSDVDGLTIGLIFGASFDVNNILLTINFDDLSFFTLEFTSQDTDFVILADWDGSNL